MPDVRTTDSVWLSRPWPDADDLTRPYWDNAAAGRLCMMKCTSCGTFRHPPTQSCESCGSGASEWVALSGAGTVYSFIVDERNMMAGFDGPYVVAMVTPAEFADGGPGPWIIANITGCDVRDVRIGMPVQVWFEPTAREGVVLPQFAPSQGTLDHDN
jgi:uncharacterized protein